MRSIEFQGITIEYDERCVKSYKWNKAINSGDSTRSTKAVERLFAGKDEYYAYALGAADPMDYETWLQSDEDYLDDDIDAFSKVLEAVLNDMGQTAKN